MIEVVAFEGPSGTGKSYRAIGVAHKKGCDAIIDDGLLIEGTKILAGTSAKTEQNKVQAVKRAIFMEKDHAELVKNALRQSKIKKILVIGTSDRMIEKICARLDLPMPSSYVRITEISSPHEMKKAREMRLKEGKHIVPVPTIELKPHLSGVLVDLPHRLFGRKKRSRTNVSDKSIVRPAFSYYGKITMSDYIVNDIVKIVVGKQSKVDKLSSVRVQRPTDANKGMSIFLELVLFYGDNIFTTVKELQNKIKEKVEMMTAMPVRNVNVSIRSLTVCKKRIPLK